MRERVFLQLNDRFAIGYNNLQWIVFGRGKKGGKFGPWASKAFVATEKRILLRVIEEKMRSIEELEGCVLTLDDSAVAALAGFPDTFQKWKAQHEAAA